MSSKESKGGAQLWGGRFEKGPNRQFYEFNRSFPFDQRLLAADLQGSAAHVSMLEDAKILSHDEARSLKASLEKIAVSYLHPMNPLEITYPEAEDVHSFIEARLIEMLGDLGKKIHAGRSRNDQVATALKLWLRSISAEVDADLRALMKGLLELADKGQGTAMPAYTHLQRAQPVLWAHWCLAYFEMLDRDRSRLADQVKRMNVMPLGSGALAGTGLPLDRNIARKELGFDSVTQNSIDGVSDRDFVIEWMAFASTLMMHLSRLSEDLILYSTHEFAFVELGDEVSSGSSLMPQKKNPDALELIRGKFGRVLGSLTGMLALMKGLPTAYNKDLQEDKEALFDCVDTTRACLQNMALVLRHVKPKLEKLHQEAGKGYMSATDLADLCVLAGMPFREAHEKIGQLVRKAISQGQELHELSEKDLLESLPLLEKDTASKLRLEACLSRKKVVGSTSPQAVAEALEKARQRLKI